MIAVFLEKGGDSDVMEGANRFRIAGRRCGCDRLHLLVQPAGVGLLLWPALKNAGGVSCLTTHPLIFLSEHDPQFNILNK